MTEGSDLGTGAEVASAATKRASWRIALGVSLSLALLIAAFWSTDLAELWGVVAAADGRLLLLGFALTISGLFLRAGRWRVLYPHGRLPYRDFLDAVNVGYLINNLAPVRLGDLVRSVLLGRWLGSGVPLALSTTLVERALDAAIMLALFFFLLPALPIPSTAVQLGLLATLAVFAALVGMLVLSGQQRRGERWLRRLFDWIPWFDLQPWVPRLVGLLRGFESLRRAGRLLAFLLWSVVLWSQAVLSYWVIMLAFVPDLPLGYAALAIVAAALGLAAPSGPAGVGTFEGAVIGAMLLVGMGAAEARSIALALHGITFLALVLAGMWSLMRRGLSYRDVMAQARTRPTPDEPT